MLCEGVLAGNLPNIVGEREYCSREGMWNKDPGIDIIASFESNICVFVFEISFKNCIFVRFLTSKAKK